MHLRYFPYTLGILLASCGMDKQSDNNATRVVFEMPKKVQMLGYTDAIMEPFLDRKGSILFFNNANEAAVNTNLHWSTKINDTVFQYQGEIRGVNTLDLEGVPTMDTLGNFYFVFTGNYGETLATIYQGNFASGLVQNKMLVSGISRNTMGWVNFDVEISPDGKMMYFVDGRFDEKGGPHEADIVLAEKKEGTFKRSSDLNDILQRVNSEALEYAAAISKNGLRLCFTRVRAPLNGNSEPRLYMASRKNENEPFSDVERIEEITGFVEGATFNDDDTGIYFHKKENGNFVLYYAKISE